MGLFPSYAAGLGAGCANTMCFAHVGRAVLGAMQTWVWVDHHCGVSIPAFSVGTGGGSSSVAEIQISLFIRLCQNTRKTTAGTGRAELWGLFLSLLGGKSKQWSTRVWEELPDPLGQLELGAGWESWCWAVVFILELLESIPRRGLGRVSPASG